MTLPAGIWPALDQEHLLALALPSGSTPALADQELAIAAGLRLSELSFSTPLLLDEHGNRHLYRLSEIGDPSHTFNLRLGLGLDLLAEDLAGDQARFGELSAPQLQGGLTLDLSETDLLALAGQVADDARDAGLALAGQISAALEGFTDLALPECPAGWFAFVNGFIDTLDRLAGQLSSQVDVLESRATALPAWVPTDWLSEASALADRFNAITDDVADFRDQWLSAEGFVSNINAIFNANDLDIHLRLLAKPPTRPAPAATTRGCRSNRRCSSPRPTISTHHRVIPGSRSTISASTDRPARTSTSPLRWNASVR